MSLKDSKTKLSNNDFNDNVSRKKKRYRQILNCSQIMAVFRVPQWQEFVDKEILREALKEVLKQAL